MQLQRIKELSIQIKKLNEELDVEKSKVLEHFRGLPKHDIALIENQIIDAGINIRYYPESTSMRVNTKKLKEDGLYEEYSMESKRSDYIKINLVRED